MYATSFFEHHTWIINYIENLYSVLNIQNNFTGEKKGQIILYPENESFKISKNKNSGIVCFDSKNNS